MNIPEVHCLQPLSDSSPEKAEHHSDIEKEETVSKTPAAANDCSKNNREACKNKVRKKMRRWRPDLARLRQLSDIKNRAESAVHSHDNFLTFIHSEESFLPRLRNSWRKGLYHWFCSGLDTYETPLSHNTFSEEYRTMVARMLGDLSHSLQFVEDEWTMAPRKDSQEELLIGACSPDRQRADRQKNLPKQLARV